MPSKSCHNCNVESDRAIRARGRGLPAWARALHCTGGAWADSGVWGLRRRRACWGASSPCTPAACPAPWPWAATLRLHGARLGGRCWNSHWQVRSGRAVYVFSAKFLPALLHPRLPFLTVENRFHRESSSQHAVCRHLFAFALEMLAKYFVHKSCKERPCHVPLVSTAGSLSETLRLSSKSWNPELLYISRGQFIFSNTYLQFSYTMIQAIPLLKPKRRETSTTCNYLSSCISVIH